MSRYRAAAHRRCTGALGALPPVSKRGHIGRARGVESGSCGGSEESARMSEVLLDVQDLVVKFPVFGGILLRRVGEVAAVKGISFQLHRGETLGLVGESGCGKTTVGRAIINILRAM